MRAPELFPEQHLHRERYKDLSDYSKVDVYSLGCILFSMAYNDMNVHPYVPLINKLDGRDLYISYYQAVNAASAVIFPSTPPRSSGIKQLIERLCDRNVATRISFEELFE